MQSNPIHNKSATEETNKSFDAKWHAVGHHSLKESEEKKQETKCKWAPARDKRQSQ